ncbi:MAG: GTP-binding protein [Deltaproteobacteria bacterium]|nr:GTP-binding protein [Deltaproteobacteria bacterium]
MSRPIPVHLICGFLGSGKTTLLRRILAEQPPAEKLVVLVNEFGELGIDGSLLEGFDSEVLELSSGCICCTLKADFISTLNKMLADFHPDRVVVEATGIAETGDLVQAVEMLQARADVELASVVTVVDAENFKYRDMLGPLFYRQMETADLILLNKIDLVEHGEVEELSEALHEINPGARIMPVVYGAVDRAIILNPQPGQPRERSQVTMPVLDMMSLLTQAPGHEGHEHEHDTTRDFMSFSFETDRLAQKECLEGFLAGLPWGVFRVKGFVRFAEGTEVLNHTYRRSEFAPSREPSGTRLAFVAWKMDQQEILAQLAGCFYHKEA